MHRANFESVMVKASTSLRRETRTAKMTRRLALLASATAAVVFVRSAQAAQFTYDANNSTATDLWSAGTDWSPSAPVSAATTQLTFAPVGGAGTFGDGITTTTTDDIAGAFSLNILDLIGTGPVTTASTVNINSSAAANLLNFISNGATTPVVNLNATAGAGLAYNINAPVNFANNTNFTGSGTATFNLVGKTTAAAGTTVQKTGTSTLTINPGSNTDAFNTLQANGGTLVLGGGTINPTNLQMAPASGNSATMNMIGGTVTVSTDFRMQAQAAGVAAFNISGGALALSKITLGAASQANPANNIITVSGSATVIQNQTGSTRELWIGGNNAGSGTLVLKDSSSWTTSTSTTANQVLIGRFGGNGILTIQDNATLTDTGSALDVGDTLGSVSTGGTINLNGGTLAVTGVNQGAGNGTANISTATFNANGGTVKALAANTNFFNGFTNATTIKVGSFNLLAGGLNFNTNNFNDTIANVMAGVGGIAKQGSGTLTLSGNSTYTGNTSVTGGTLLVNGTQSAASGTPNINISSGAVLGGIGTIAGAFDHTAGTVSAATVGTIGTLTLSGALTLDGGTATFDVNGANVSTAGNNSTAGDQIQVNNNLTFGAAPETINFSFSTPGSLPAGSFTYRLFGYTGTLSGAPNLAYTSNLGRSTFSTSTATAGEVDAIVTPVAATLNWNSTSGGVWDVQTTPNWYNTATSAGDVFFNGDSVNFVDNNAHSTPANGQLQTTITLNTTVSPGSVTDSANSNAYTISGTGSIAGVSALNVTGTAPLTLTTTNTYTGGTTIGAGATIQLGDGTAATGSLGTGPVTDNGTLITNYGGAGTVSLPNTITGAGGYTKNGSATVSMTGANTYSGNTTVNNGTLQLDGTGSLLGAGNVVDNATIAANGTNTIAGNLTGAGALTTTGTSTLKLTGNNAAFAGTTTVNTGTTLQIGVGGTAGTLPGGTLNVTGTLTFDRSDAVALANPLNVPAGTVAHIGTGTVTLTGANSIRTLSIGTNVPAGTVVVPSGASLSVGSVGVGALNVASSPNDGNSALSAGTLDASQASSFTANVATVSVGLAGNHAVTGNSDTASGNLLLPPSSTITATTSFVVGDSAGARNGDTGTIPNNSSSLTIPGGGTTTVNTPIFTIGGTKSTASFTLGAGGQFNLAGVGTGGRTFMSVGNIVTGGGGGIYVDNADLSAGVVNLTLSNLVVGDNFNNTGSGAASVSGTLHIGASPLNHIDISGQVYGPVGNQGVVVIGRQSSNSTATQTGVLTIDNLDATSSISVVDASNAITNGTAISVGGVQTAGNSNGTLNLNGGSITFNTTGSAIASDNNAFETFPTQGTAIVNFNGTQLIAGAASTTWIENIVLFDGVSSGARVGAGGLKISTNGFDVTVPQPFVTDPNLSGVDGGLAKTGAGTLTLTGAQTYTGNTTVGAGGTLAIASTSSLPSTNVTANGGVALSNASQTFNTLNGAATGSLVLNGTALTINAGGTFNGAWNDGTSAGSITVSGGPMTFGGATAPGGTLNANATTNFAGTTGGTPATRQLAALNIGSGVTAAVTHSTFPFTPTILNPASLTFGGGAKLDLSNNELIAPGTAAAALTLIQNSQVISSEPADAVHALGYITVPATTNMEIRYTLKGDTNLDGKVDVGDLGALATSYGITGGMSWANGDFNQDGNVDVGDLGALATSYGTQLATGPSVGDGLSAAAVPAASVSSAAVPEPTALGLIGIGAVGLMSRRRHRRCAN